jgi:urea carboxylase
MEGPGGYQLVGRTLQVFNRHRTSKDFARDKPWLLRFFDQIRFFSVSERELAEMRDAFSAGRYPLNVDEEIFSLSDYNAFLSAEADSIAAFKLRQQTAFEAERQRWLAEGLLNFGTDDEPERGPSRTPEGAVAIASPIPGSVWKVEIAVGTKVVKGQRVMVLESMKMEMSIDAHVDGTIATVEVTEGQAVRTGQPVAFVLVN